MKLRLFSAKKDVSDGESNNATRAFVHSLEGGIYLLEIESSGVSQFLENPNDQKPRTFISLHHAKNCAKKMQINHIELVMNTPYDQMIGLATCS